MKLSIFLSFIFLLNSSCLLQNVTYDCDGTTPIQGRVSNSVIVANNPQLPRLNRAGVQNVVCRNGFPDNYILPWDEALRERGLENLVNLNQQEEAEEVSNELDIRIDAVGDYWFEFSPLIDNRTPFHLVIESIDFKIRSGGSSETNDRSIEGSSYCESTGFLYWLEPGEAINRSDRTRSFNKGNLKIYIDGLEPPEDQNLSVDDGFNFQITTVPSFNIRYRMNGYFACSDGAQRAGFESLGSFRVTPPTF